MLEKIRENFLSFVFPTTCLFCGFGEKAVCENCYYKIPVNKEKINNILSLYHFQNEKINKLLWRLKYHHTHDIAKVFGKVLAGKLNEELKTEVTPENIYLIPIPLSVGDKRMHNHAELIATEISKHLNNTKVLPNILIKKSKIKQAHTKSRRERFENIKNSFSINPKNNFKHTENNRYIIVDDISTTGATINEARSVLAEYLQIDESDIFAVTIAH